MEVFWYVLIAIFAFFIWLGLTGDLGASLLVAVTWPLVLIFLFLSLFFGIGKYF